MDKKREKLWEKLDKEDRNFKWFHKNYLSGIGLHYNTLYQQAKGDILTKMSQELQDAIDKYTGE